MRRRLCAAILSLETVVLGLTTPVLVQNLDTWLALMIGLGLAVLCLLVAGTLRFEAAYYVGWAIQVAAIGLGFIVTAMFVLGVIFFVLWLTANRLGAMIDRDQAAAAAVAPD